MRLFPAAVLLAFLSALLPGAAAGAEAPRAYSLTYDFWQGGFNPLILETQIRRSENGYRAEFEVGLAFAVDLQSRATFDEQWMM